MTRAALSKGRRLERNFYQSQPAPRHFHLILLEACAGSLPLSTAGNSATIVLCAGVIL
jgi:hypothetical protein